MKKILLVLATGITILAIYSPGSLALCSDNTPSCGGPSGNTSGQSGSSQSTSPPLASSLGCDPNATQGGPGYCGTPVTLGQDDPKCNSNASAQTCLNSVPFIHNDVQAVVDFLSGAVGLVVVGMLIAGGVQYTMAGDSPEAVNKAKTRMTNGLIALFVFLFMFAFIQWLIPGGIFG